ncbi:MAG: hypothetical protein GY909_00780 [Oligoflexia bacterium]|nr:hypothetical protein [Oligoflexia bacterium]
MSELFYRWLHFSSIIIFFVTLGITFLGPKDLKLPKIVTGVMSLIILVAGMGLILKGLNIRHVEPWPMWLKVKVALWAILAIAGPVLAKRLQEHRGKAVAALSGIAILAVYLVVFKPF